MAMIWREGEWREESEGCLSFDDRAVLHGMAAFETMLAIDGRLQHADRHLRRLRHAIARMGLRALGDIDLTEVAQTLCEKNSLSHGIARLRLTVTAGQGALHSGDPGERATVWLTAQPLVALTTPVALVTLPFTRNESSALVGMKTTSYAENLIALRWARERGADEGIFFNNRGELCEACTANVFVRIDGAWLTPALSSGCLPGIMREVVLEKNPHIREAIITREQFLQADQMVLTSALRGLTLVQRCDEKSLALADEALWTVK